MGASASREQAPNNNSTARKAIIVHLKQLVKLCSITHAIRASTVNHRQEKVQRPETIVLKRTIARLALEFIIIQETLTRMIIGRMMHQQGAHVALVMITLTRSRTFCSAGSTMLSNYMLSVVLTFVNCTGKMKMMIMLSKDVFTTLENPVKSSHRSYQKKLDLEI